MTNANFQIIIHEERSVIQSTPFKLSKKFLLIVRNFQKFPEIPQDSQYFEGIPRNSQEIRGGQVAWVVTRLSDFGSS